MWISSRASLQSTLSALVMLLAYDSWRRTASRRALAGLVGGAFLGFFSKEDALMIFPVLALYEWFLRRENLSTLARENHICWRWARWPTRPCCI